MTTPVIQIPRDPALLKATHDFHLEQVGEFLLPRTAEEFRHLANLGNLWVMLDRQDVIAACYVKRSDDDDEAEFGGIILDHSYRGTGLATAIGVVAISAHALHDDVTRLVAHVHVDNNAPISLLTKQLGFTPLDKPVRITKAEIEAKLGRTVNMRADENGNIYGNTYEFSLRQLATFADQLEKGSIASVPVHINNRYFEGDALGQSIEILRGLAKKANA